MLFLWWCAPVGIRKSSEYLFYPGGVPEYYGVGPLNVLWRPLERRV
jgi:hypothetical protein